MPRTHTELEKHFDGRSVQRTRPRIYANRSVFISLCWNECDCPNATGKWSIMAQFFAVARMLVRLLSAADRLTFCCCWCCCRMLMLFRIVSVAMSAKFKWDNLLLCRPLWICVFLVLCSPECPWTESRKRRFARSLSRIIFVRHHFLYSLLSTSLFALVHTV